MADEKVHFRAPLVNNMSSSVKALAFNWPAAHRSPKLHSSSQGVSAQTDNGSSSSRKLSKVTTVLHSLGRDGSCQHTIVCSHMVCMRGRNAGQSAAHGAAEVQRSAAPTHTKPLSTPHSLTQCFIRLSSALQANSLKRALIE